jgi:methionyl-tRNA formyltransferase
MVTLLNKHIIFWCCKSLGLNCLRYLYEVIGDLDLGITVDGVVISSRDSMAPQIEMEAARHGSTIYVDHDVLPTNMDLGLCIGFPHLISAETLDSFRVGVVNLHFAPLPQYRGSRTLPRAIINGDHEYGVTLHYMDARLDTGPIIEVAWRPLSDTMTTQEALPLFEAAGFDLFQKYCAQLLTQEVIGVPQAELIETLGVKPQFCTKKQLLEYYQVPVGASFDEMYRVAQALKMGKEGEERPFLEENGRKLYLELG